MRRAAGYRRCRGFESRVSAGRCRDLGLQTSRSHRDRDRRPACPQRARRTLSAALSQRGANLFTGRRSAELIKYAANAFWRPRSPSSMRLPACANELVPTCRKSRAVLGLITGSARNSCMPARAMADLPAQGCRCADEDRAGSRLSAPHRRDDRCRQRNRKRAMARKVAAALDGEMRADRCGSGLTFKPNTDDMREAPSIALITALEDMGASIRAYDPAGMIQAKPVLPTITVCDGPYAASKVRDALVIVTEWEEFRALDLNRLRNAMAMPVLVDLKNVYQPEELIRAGFRFEGIGRPSIRLAKWGGRPRRPSWPGSSGRIDSDRRFVMIAKRVPCITPVIMCGGAGTRLWPVSRESMPKQFVPLVGDPIRRFTRCSRVSRSDLFDRPIVDHQHGFPLCGRRAAARARRGGRHRDRAHAARLRPRRCGRSRAGGRAGSGCARTGPGGRSCHPQAPGISRRLSGSGLGGAAGQIVAFGITPTFPATSYGYIRPGAPLDGGLRWRSTPSSRSPMQRWPPATLRTAIFGTAAISCSGRQRMLSEIEHFEPEMAEAAKEAVAGLVRDLEFLRLAAEPFARAPKKSIDYAVMERTKLAAVVPADLGWSDVGSWSAVWDVLDHDGDGNAADGPAALVDSHNSLVRSDEFGADHRGRPRQCRRGLDRRRGPGVGARQDRARESAGRKTQDAEPARSHRASPHLPALGLLSGCRPRRAVSRQAHRGEVRAASCRCRSISIGPSIGLSSKARRRSRSATRPETCTKTNPSIFRSKASTALPIPARFRSNLSRCKSAAIWAKTTSCASTTLTAAAEQVRLRVAQHPVDGRSPRCPPTMSDTIPCGDAIGSRLNSRPRRSTVGAPGTAH